jgi:ankyrin repeat protein
VYVNARRKDHWTPLHLASYCGKPEVTRLLLAHGADAHAEDDFFRTPLHQVARGLCHSQADGVRISQLLLECSADVNAQDVNRETPLHLASASGKLEIVRVLLECATAKNYRGQSLSHLSFEGKSHAPI